ncbi:MAG TPA: hypothetical protein VIJ71_07385 [Mycobacteriales bacterium]
MIRAAAVVPHPPLLLPGVGGRSDPLADLRARSLEAIAALGAGPVIVLRTPQPSQCGGANAAYATRSTGHIGGEVGYDVAGWLCSAARIEPVETHVVTDDRLTAVADGAALLVLADGSAARGPKAPAGPHPGAQASDDALAAALAAGDAVALAAYDPDPALGAEGAPALRALGRLAADHDWDARVLAYEAPFGVAYVVAQWT